LINQTIYTTRIEATNDPVAYSITLSQFIYQGTKPGNKPNSVILANKDDYKFTLPVASLIHFPNNAPILLTDKTLLDKKVEDELKRLSPADKVFLTGDLTDSIEQSVKKLGLTPYKILSNDPIEHAVNIYNFLKKPMEIMIVSVDNFEEALLACSWAAHMATPIILTNKNKLPSKTIDLIKQNNITSIYIIGSKSSISFDIVKEIKGIKEEINVQWINGNNAFETNVNFMKFHDTTTMFGWGSYEKQGYSLTFCNKDNWQHGVCSSILAHTGKHAPLMLINNDNVPTEVKNYIDSVNPSNGMAKPPFMHGYIGGGTEVISYNTQVDLDSYLKNVAWLGNRRIEKMSYKLKNGDTIQSLAELYNISQQDIMQLNPDLSPDMLQMGQPVTIPVTLDLQ
jgi:hypothetical protein